MSSHLDLSCPNCQKGLRVPPALAGKRVKCKQCNHPFVIPAAAEQQSAPTPAAAAAQPAAPKGRFDEEDVVQEIGLIVDDLAPRCPFCAQELDPPDAIVCVHCGFNSRTRTKAYTKKVWAPDAMDWITHLFPGIVALVIFLGVLVFDIVCFISMSDWMKGSIFDKNDEQAYINKPDTIPEFHVKPGAFITLITGFSVFILVPTAKLAYRRLVKEFKPEEKIKK
jgi:hypothetical protein